MLDKFNQGGRDGREKLARIKANRKLKTAALERADLSMLTEAIEDAESFDYKTVEVERSMFCRNTIPALQDATKSFDTEGLKVGVDKDLDLRLPRPRTLRPHVMS